MPGRADVHVTYANCHPDAGDVGDVLLTDERIVADGAPPGTVAVIADERYDAGLAQRLNERLWELAFTWSQVDGEDPTLVDGLSAGDLAGLEVGLTVLLPAARAVLEIDAALRDLEPERFTSVVPAAGDALYRRVETTICDAADATIRARLGANVALARRRSSDPRNATLVTKYSRTRNPAFLAEPSPRTLAALRATAAIVNLAAARRRPARAGRLLVLQYNPTAAFVRNYASSPRGVHDLVCAGFAQPDVARMLREGQRAFVMPAASPGPQAAALAARVRAFAQRHEDVLRERFTVEGVDLSAVVLPRLGEIAAAYGRWLEGRGRAVRTKLRRLRAGALLVPFESPPHARLLVRAAQAEGVASVMINDGWKGDDHQRDGMTSDVALALSPSIAEHYFRRRDDPASVVVTGDPRSDGAPPPRASRRRDERLRRVLVGSFTFSPSDLNCRRSDGERFLAEVLEGIAASRARDAAITVKLHPADQLEIYRDVVARFGELELELTREGDVVDRLAQADVYVTTYSTSLLQAAALGLPFLYYRVNPQRLHPPFSGDPTMERRMASTPAGLATLLDAPLSAPEDARRWIERYVGPSDGACTARVIDAVNRAGARAPR